MVVSYALPDTAFRAAGECRTDNTGCFGFKESRGMHRLITQSNLKGGRRDIAVTRFTRGDYVFDPAAEAPFVGRNSRSRPGPFIRMAVPLK